MLDLPPNLNEVEKDCIRHLARLHESGKIWWGGHELEGTDLINDGNRASLVSMLLHYRFIKMIPRQGAFSRGGYDITPLTEQAAREFEKEERKVPDKVEAIKDMFKKHPFFSWLIVLFAGYVAVITAASQTMNVLEKTGITSKTKSAP